VIHVSTGPRKRVPSGLLIQASALLGLIALVLAIAAVSTEAWVTNEDGAEFQFGLYRTCMPILATDPSIQSANNREDCCSKSTFRHACAVLCVCVCGAVPSFSRSCRRVFASVARPCAVASPSLCRALRQTGARTLADARRVAAAQSRRATSA
jgi:hypothetical protein